MISYDIARAKAAVQYLVDSVYFTNHVKKLRSHVVRPRAMPFRDDAETLNELLVIGRQNLQAMENLIEVAEFKRDDPNAYMRTFMQAKRQRDRKVIQLEELLQGKKLSLDERRALLTKQYEIWNAEREKFLKKNGDLEWAMRNAALKKFWVKREQEIDELIAEANKAQERHKRKKYVVEVVKPKDTAIRSAMQKAIDKRR